MDSRGAWTCFWSLRVWNIYQVFSIPYNVFHGILVSNFNSLEMQIHVWILMLFTSMRIWKTTRPLITLSTFIKCWIHGQATRLGLLEAHGELNRLTWFASNFCWQTLIKWLSIWICGVAIFQSLYVYLHELTKSPNCHYNFELALFIQGLLLYINYNLPTYIWTWYCWKEIQ